MAKGQTVVVSIPFKYHADPNKNYELDRGEVIGLEDLANDSVLIGLSYLVPAKARDKGNFIDCPDCGRKFSNVHYMHIHKAKRDGCFSKGKEITRGEIAEKLDVDPNKIDRLEQEFVGDTQDVRVVS